MLTSGAAQRRSVIVSVCLTLFFLLIARRIVGLSDGDDSWYQDEAVHLHPYNFIREHYWSPLYQLWFRIFSIAIHNPLWCYFTCWVVLVLLFALLPVLLRVRYAWIYTFLFVVYPFPLFSPYSGMFGGMLAVLALCLLLRSQPTYSGALAASCAMSFVVSACRSEFDTAVIISAIATLVALAIERRQPVTSPAAQKRPWMTAVAVVVMAGCTIFVLTHAVGQRSGMAFAQHFNLRATMRGQIPERGFAASNWAELQFHVDTQHNAGNGSAGMKDFFLANPRLFLKHVGYNIFDPRTVLSALLMLFALSYPWRMEHAKHLRPASLFMAIFLIPAFMDLCLVFPRDHYIMLLVPCVTLFALQAIPSGRLLQPPVWIIPVGMVTIVYINLIVPKLTVRPPAPDKVYLSRVQCARAIDGAIPASNHFVFDDHLIRNVYLIHPRTQLDDFTLVTWEQFKAWALTNRPAWISASDDVESSYHVTPAQLDSFLQQDLGYTPHHCSDTAYMTIYTAKNP